MQTKRGKFIVFDGMDGSGKGTQIDLIKQKLPDAFFTHEPGGKNSATAEFLRTVILEPEKFGIAPVPLCDFFLFWASRAQHVEEVVEPKRAAGIDVLSDRYDSSTMAFQIFGEKKKFAELLRQVRLSVPGYYWPEAYIFFDLPAEVAYERRKRDAEQAKTRFDVRPIEYHERVREGFRQFVAFVAGSYSKAYIVDANRPPEAIHADVWAIVQKVLAS